MRSLLALFLIGAVGLAQNFDSQPLRTVKVDIDTGVLANSGDRPALVFSRTLDVEGAAWVEVPLEALQLQGDSYLRLTSTEQNQELILRRSNFDPESHGSVALAGPRIRIELYAAPGTHNNLLTIAEVLATDNFATVEEEPVAPSKLKGPPRIICSTVDARISNKTPGGDDRDAAVGRLNLRVRETTSGVISAGICTASLARCEGFDQPNQTVFLTASHCFEAKELPLAATGVPVNSQNVVLTSATVQFNPPLSTGHVPAAVPPILACRLNPAAPGKQFPVIFQTVRRGLTAAVPAGQMFAGSNTDWAVFRTARNAGTGNTAFGEQAAAYPLDLAGANMTQLDITGFGTDGGNPNAAAKPERHCKDCSATNAFGTSTLNGTQQIAAGNASTVTGDKVFYSTHTCGGNSGSLLVQTRGNPARKVGVGVHTGGQACAAGDVPINRGTHLGHAEFRDSVREVCNLCDQNNDKTIDHLDIALIRGSLGTRVTPTTAPLVGRLDADADGAISVRDERICANLCNNRGCL